MNDVKAGGNGVNKNIFLAFSWVKHRTWVGVGGESGGGE